MTTSLQIRRGVAAALGIAGLFALLLGVHAGTFHSPLAWLPLGVTAGLLIRWDRSIWPWAAAGAALAGLFGQRASYGVLPGALLMVTGPWVLAWLLERSGFQKEFARRGDVLRFVVATPLAMLVPATLTLVAMAAFAPTNDALRDPLPRA